MSRVILYHSSGADVAAQVVGRAHRLGRTHNLQVYTLYNQDEYQNQNQD